MKLTIIAALMATGVSFSGIAMAAQPPVFTPQQEARIGEIARDYLLAHPEVLIQVSQELQEQQQKQQQDAMMSAALQHQTALIQDKDTPSYGPQNAKVALVEFFDYQCSVCARQAPILAGVMQSNPQVRFVFKEWPIFARRWDNSMQAAKTGLQIWRQKGAQAYLDYHNAIYATGHDEGKLTADDIAQAAAKAGKLTGSSDDGLPVLARTDALAQSIGLGGTPGLIVMPTHNATLDNITVMPGGVDAKTLQAAINKAAAGQKK